MSHRDLIHLLSAYLNRDYVSFVRISFYTKSSRTRMQCAICTIQWLALCTNSSQSTHTCATNFNVSAWKQTFSFFDFVHCSQLQLVTSRRCLCSNEPMPKPTHIPNKAQRLLLLIVLYFSVCCLSGAFCGRCIFEFFWIFFCFCSLRFHVYNPFDRSDNTNYQYCILHAYIHQH